MSDKGNIAIIGDKDSVLIFKAIGLEVYDEIEPLSAARRIAQLARDGVKIIFIIEKLYFSCSETISKYRGEAYPAIIPIPDSQGSTGASMATIRANVEKAIGADILFTED